MIHTHSAILRAISMIVLTALLAVSGTVWAASAKTINVTVSIPPQAFFVERIGGERVSVETVIQPGRDPHTYEITPRQMAALSETNVFFRIGMPFERGVIPKLRNTVPDMLIIDTRSGIRLRLMEPHAHGGHSHDGHPAETGHDPHDDADMHPETAPAGDQPDTPADDPAGKDPHIWLAPDLIAVQADTICDTLSRIDPDHAALFRKNLDAFRDELKALDAEIHSALKDLPDRAFMVFHPSWGYFADAYGLHQIAVEVEGKSPSARQLARTIDLAKEKGIRTIIVQPQFSRKSARTIAAAIDGTVTAVDPLGKDVFAVLREMTQVIRTGRSPDRS